MSAGAMTFEQAMALLDKNHAKSRAEMEMTFKQAEARFDKSIAESRAERALFEKNSAESWAKIDKVLAEFRAEREKAEEERKKADEKFNRMQKSLGSFQRNLGEMVEFILIPKIRKKINQYGHRFDILSPNKQYINSKNGLLAAEVDLLLENCEEVLAVEIKSNFKVAEVRDHLKQLAWLRKHEKTTGMTGKIIYAGIAGITVSESVRKLALASGMYVIVIHEEDERVDVIPPETEGRW
jgi:hypothetical protein